MYDKSGKLIDRREMLKIKARTLQLEAMVIRSEENKLLTNPKDPAYTLYKELHFHRVYPLRKEGRLTTLALGFIRGRQLIEMEATTRKPLTAADWAAILSMVKKYGKSGMELYIGYEVPKNPTYLLEPKAFDAFVKPSPEAA